jgi:hypothetical protein
MKFEIKLEEFEKVEGKLTRFEERLALTKSSDQQALSDSFALIMTEDVRERFMSSPGTTTGGNVYGGVYWRKLSDSYLLRKPERANGKVLIDTTRLMSSFKIDSGELVSEFTDQYTYKFGTQVPYAEKLQKTWPVVVFHQELMVKLRDAYLSWAYKVFDENFYD